ncbi:hypothetical protein Tco_1541820 [Tanacetum coccineum]
MNEENERKAGDDKTFCSKPRAMKISRLIDPGNPPPSEPMNSQQVVTMAEFLRFPTFAGSKILDDCKILAGDPLHVGAVHAGGPSYPVELRRLNGLSSTAASVGGKLSKPNHNLE